MSIPLFPLWFGVKQAFLSAAGSLVLGSFLAFSLFACSDLNQVRRVRLILLAPNFVPALFVILSVMSFSQWLGWSHQGLFWVVLTHSLMNAGLFAVAIHTVFRGSVERSWEVARVLGASRALCFWRVGLPQVLSSIRQNFILVFALCLVSFSIPLVLGGASSTSLEVHIFRLVRSEGNWQLALFYSVMQMLLVLLLAVVISRGEQRLVLGREENWGSYLILPSWMRWTSLLPIFALTFFWIKDVVLDFPLFFGDLGFQRFLFSSAMTTAGINSCLLFLFVFLMQTFFAMVVVWNAPSLWLARFFNGLIAPSVAVLGFALLMLPGDGGWSALFKTALCLTLLTFPLLFKWQVLHRWESLKEQIEVARVLGAGPQTILWSVTWPQVKEMSFQMALIASVWSLGEFAVSSFFFENEKTVALFVVEFLNSYRLEWASALSLLVFGLGVFFFYFSQRFLNHVRD